jgi:MFS family permease
MQTSASPAAVFDQRRSVYYGWANLALAALAMVGTLPGRTQGLGLITEPLLADLHLDRVAYATINLWGTLIGALFCLPCGRLLDRWGSRMVISSVLFALGTTVVTMSRATGLAALWIAVTLTRGFGQSALSVASLALVGKWFARRLSIAMGVYSLAVGIGFVAAFPGVGQAVLRFGWRAAWLGVGSVLVLIFAPLAWLVVRDSPEQEGLPLDGSGDGGASAADFTLGQALSTPAFWTFALSSAVFGLVYSGIALFNQSILEQRGFGPAIYYRVLAVSTLLGLASNFAGGWLASRWPIPQLMVQRLMGIGMAVLAGALLALPMVTTVAHVMMYAAAMGISGGVVTVVFFSVWGQVFGRAHLGRIQGAAQIMTVLASAAGPLLLAKTLERTGSYDLLFYQVAAIVIVLGLGSWFVPLPVLRER